MGMPVRLSDELMELARSASEAATRSLTAQVEHWALIGRAVETALDHGSVSALKASGGNMARAFPDAGHRKGVAKAILEVVRDVDRAALRRRIAAGKGPRYGVERSSPEAIVRYPAADDAKRASVHEKSAGYAPRKSGKRD